MMTREAIAKTVLGTAFMVFVFPFAAPFMLSCIALARAREWLVDLGWWIARML